MSGSRHYGIGGHATLALLELEGVLAVRLCGRQGIDARISVESEFSWHRTRMFTVSHGGCGDLFLPYSAIASNHTATMAADLASRYLLGDIDNSSKVSWKGDSGEALKQGLELTYRYGQFQDNLTAYCRCSIPSATSVADSPSKVRGTRAYRFGGRKRWWRVWQEHRQIQVMSTPNRSAYLLVQHRTILEDIYVEDVTTPMPGDLSISEQLRFAEILDTNAPLMPLIVARMGH